MINKKITTLPAFQATLKRGFMDIATKKATTKAVVYEVADFFRGLSINEQETALSWLVTIPDFSEEMIDAVADLNRRNTGNSLEKYPMRQFDRGPEGFDQNRTGPGDPTTYNQQLETDRKALLKKLRNIKMDLPNDGMSRSSVRNAADAISRMTGNLDERREARVSQDRYVDAVKMHAVQMLKRITKGI
jgi:hypothetical protein